MWHGVIGREPQDWKVMMSREKFEIDLQDPGPIAGVSQSMPLSAGALVTILSSSLRSASMPASAATFNRNSLSWANSIAASLFTRPNARKYNEAPILYEDNHHWQCSWWNVSGPSGATIEREGFHYVNWKRKSCQLRQFRSTFFSRGSDGRGYLSHSPVTRRVI